MPRSRCVVFVAGGTSDSPHRGAGDDDVFMVCTARTSLFVLWWIQGPRRRLGASRGGWGRGLGGRVHSEGGGLQGLGVKARLGLFFLGGGGRSSVGVGNPQR